ncbi:helix-turn-helix transcriptional regulator [Paludibacterium sp.]|uniref:helix-turn-helix domain-containing protein n=1 Tax=Paludibacterium sp. TaxID=1917523 RepID=UPI0025D17130|nr:helix-turn-helix transcriptional regulator [Paludibacterium sp.]MBV8649625.1 helix-turn-helix transcriptional regulator [Paludibacterium sp.]
MTMFLITARQIKAARGLLDWSQDELAAASGLSGATIRSLEAGSISPQSLRKVQAALEGGGVAFCDNQGVTLRQRGTVCLEGRDATARFLADLEGRTAGGSTVRIVSQSTAHIMAAFGITAGDTKPLTRLAEKFDFECVTGSAPSEGLLEDFSVRYLPRQIMNPSSVIIYGDSAAIFRPSTIGTMDYCVFHILSFVGAWRSEFAALWNSAIPVVVPIKAGIKSTA